MNGAHGAPFIFFNILPWDWELMGQQRSGIH
jgi:hypothetical protein